MEKDTSNKDLGKQEPTARESDLKNSYNSFIELLKKKSAVVGRGLDGLDNEAIRKFLMHDYKLLNEGINSGTCRIDEAITVLEGLEEVIGVLSKGKKSFFSYESSTPAEIKAVAREVAKKPMVKSKLELESATCTDLIKYVADYIVKNPAIEKLYCAQIIKDLGIKETTARSYIQKNRLPIPAKKEQRKIYLENEIVRLGEFAVPKSTLAAWKKFGTLDENELYLYAPHGKVNSLKSLVDKYVSKLSIEFPDLDPFYGFKYPYFRQLAKNERLSEIFNKVLDTEDLSKEESDKIKSMKGEQTFLHKYEHVAIEESKLNVYYLTKYADVPKNDRHMLKPITELLKERGLFLPEIVQILDKPVSRVFHALEILMGKKQTSCVYNLMPETESCPQIGKVADTLALPTDNRGLSHMSPEMRIGYTEALRYGIKPEIKDAKSKGYFFAVNVGAQEFQIRRDGLYKGSQKTDLSDFSKVLKKAYHKRFE